MKKQILIVVLILTLALVMFGCGNKAENTETKEEAKEETATEEVEEEKEEAEEAVEEEEPEETAEEATETEEAKEEEKAEEPAAEETKEEEAKEEEPTAEILPYSWTGLQDIPKCKYLDTIADGKYIQTYDYYVAGMKAEVIEAMDGVNSFKDDGNTLTLSVDGKILSLNNSSKIYVEYDMTETIDAAKESLKTAIEKGTNMYGRNFVGTGKETIPAYSDEGDATEYEYYEYNYPESEAAGYKMVEKFYVKDGDIFAIYQKISINDTDTETTTVIKSVSDDIPEGTFDFPDLEGYTKYEG